MICSLNLLRTSQNIEPKQEAKETKGWSFFNLFRGKPATANPQIKHLDPKLSKNNLAKGKDTLKAKMPVIGENEGMPPEFEYAKGAGKQYASKKGKMPLKVVIAEQPTRDEKTEISAQLSSQYSKNPVITDSETLNEMSFDMKPMNDFFTATTSNNQGKKSESNYPTEDLETENIYDIKLENEEFEEKPVKMPKQMTFEKPVQQKGPEKITPQKTIPRETGERGMQQQQQPLRAKKESAKDMSQNK